MNRKNAAGVYRALGRKDTPPDLPADWMPEIVTYEEDGVLLRKGHHTTPRGVQVALAYVLATKEMRRDQKEVPTEIMDPHLREAIWYAGLIADAHAQWCEENNPDLHTGGPR